MPKLRHAFVSAKSDGADSSLVRPSNWNAALQYESSGSPSGTDALVREMLSANRTYYVRTDGSNSNSGLANSSSGAFATFQFAYDYVVDNVEAAGYTVTIKAGNSGTYSGGVVATTPFDGSIVFEGDTTTPSNVTIAGGANDAFRADNVQITVKGFKLTSTSQSGLLSTGLGKIDVTGLMDFGACSFAHINATLGGLVHIGTDYTYSGATTAHMNVTSQGIIRNDATTATGSGNPAITLFAYADTGGIIMAAGPTGTGITWATPSSAISIKYGVDTNGVIFTNNLGASYFPGALAGSATGGGVYDGASVYKTGTTTVASLPAAGTAGRRYFVTDASTTTFASTVTAGSTYGVPVYDDGTNWRIG